MTQLDRFSERFAAVGGQAAEGVINQLGRPGMEPLEVLVREAVQNCADAAFEGATVAVSIGHLRLTGEQCDALFTRAVPDPPPRLGLANIDTTAADILYFADFGTKGLGGLTRADVDDGSPRDFVDFIRNIGQPPDTTHGGGSYGYGKAAFYLVSRAGVVVVDTISRHDGERRLIAYGLGGHYTEKGVPHTGRHWWGLMRDGVPEPALDDDARELSEALGLPHRARDDFGTTVAIVAPRLAFADEDDDRGDPDQAMAFIRECLLWNFWPKMVAPPEGSPAMRFTVACGGVESELPDPSTHDRLAPFVEALQLLRAGSPTPHDPFLTGAELLCRRPRQQVGNLAVRHCPTHAVEVPDRVPQAAKQLSGGHHHVALMRQVELVVRYVDGPVKSIPGQGYAGVFKSDPELDEVFRASEPPTHDDWQPAGLDEWAHRRFVGTALRRINEYLGEMVGTSLRPESAAATGSLPLGLVADELGGLLRGIGGSGAGRAGPLAVPTREGIELGGGPTEGGSAGAGGTHTNGGERARVRRPSIRSVGAPTLVHLDDGSAEVRAEFVLETAGRPVKLLGTAEVLTMDGSQVERIPPRGADQPRITRWIAPSGRQSLATSADAAADESGTWVVAASHDPDLMIRIGIDLEAAET